MTASSHIAAADTSADPGRNRVRARLAGRAALLAFVAIALTVLWAGRGQEWQQSFSVIFSSIVLEALPFMILGALVGGFVEVFVSRDRLTALLPQRGWQTVLTSAALGLLFPVCECAVVPVVRRLARKGLPASAAIAYLLAGPVVNPVVGASTALAYRFDWRIVAARLGLGYLIAVSIALLMEHLFRRQAILLKEVSGGGKDECSGHHGHAENSDAYRHKHDGQAAGTDHSHECCCHDHGPHGSTVMARIVAACRHAFDDFADVGHFLIIGAFVAALAQTFVGRAAFVEMAQTPGLAVGLAIVLAVLLNLCSEADAFIAASFRGFVPLSAQMAFMLTGPMFDLKLLLMYTGLFRARAIVFLSLLIVGAVFIVSLVFGLLGGVSS